MLNRIRAGGAVVVGEPHAAPGDVEIGAVAHGVAQTKPGAAGKILGAAEAEAAGVGPAEGPQRRLRNMVAWAMAAGPVAPTGRLPRASAKGSGRCWRCGASEARAGLRWSAVASAVRWWWAEGGGRRGLGREPMLDRVAEVRLEQRVAAAPMTPIRSRCGRAVRQRSDRARRALAKSPVNPCCAPSSRPPRPLACSSCCPAGASASPAR